ncbi:hypothetical protein RhiLY_08046 [Ceratobasidium sp. AG-Ba]|nr:hypothetical protein RhiLY_08046 [Ceratobasidium sp. AG-Ba]
MHARARSLFTQVCQSISSSSNLIPFQLKPICTSIIRQSTPDLAPLLAILEHSPPTDLTPALIEYVFYPISQLLQRHPIKTLPNRTVEQLFLVLSLLAEEWFWSCDPGVWEQLVILASSVLAGIDGQQRDEETYLAATKALCALFHPPNSDAQSRIDVLASLTPVATFGKTLSSLLLHTPSPNITLQQTSLSVLLTLVEHYFPLSGIPSILPGTVSNMSKVILELGGTRGQSVALALDVLRVTIVKGISDEICIKDGALKDIQTIDDLFSPPSPPQPETKDPTSTPRTPAWLNATSSQTHMALNTLSSALSHPNPTARLAFARLCAQILQSTPRALPQSQTLLLGHLLALAYPALPHHTHQPMEDAKEALASLHTLAPLLSEPLNELTSRALSVLPHRLASPSSSASLLARQLTTSSYLSPQFPASLLGPSGKIDKWGLTLLRSLVFTSPAIVPLTDPAKLIEPDSGSLPSGPEFPVLRLKGIDDEIHKDVEEMFTSMGRAAGDRGTFAIEWFAGVGVESTGERQVAAMWCALTLLRGALSSNRKNAKMVKTAKWIGRAVADLWDDAAVGTDAGEKPSEKEGEVLDLVPTEHIKGLNPLTTLLDRPAPASSSIPGWKRTLELQAQHTSLALQLISTSHVILGTSSTSITLLQHTLYPLLQGLLSPIGLVSSTAHAALTETAHALGYASPPNMLLANFDYALESVSSRLAVFSAYTNIPLPAGSQPQSTAPSLSIQALQVLRALIRLIGQAIVDRAYDVLDECFDRLDDYHGYSLVVQALIDVLAEVVEAVGREDKGLARENEREEREPEPSGEEIWQGFKTWFKQRGEKKQEDDEWKLDPNEPEPDTEPRLSKDDKEQQETFEPPPLSATESLTRAIIARSTYFLTHASPHIRARILSLLATAAPTLRSRALMPTIHASWPFILNRMEDKEMWVVQKAFELVEVLSRHVGDFMARRVWDDVWPRFERLLKAQAHTALTRRNKNFPARPSAMDDLGPLTLARLHLSILRTLTSAITHVDPRDDALWAVLLACRRFLKREEREDVQAAAREMYIAVAKRNADGVWLVLCGMLGERDGTKMPGFLEVGGWDVRQNVELILNEIE